MYLFKVLRTQKIDIINVVNVLPVSLFLTLNSYQYFIIIIISLFSVDN